MASIDRTSQWTYMYSWNLICVAYMYAICLDCVTQNGRTKRPRKSEPTCVFTGNYIDQIRFYIYIYIYVYMYIYI